MHYQVHKCHTDPWSFVTKFTNLYFFSTPTTYSSSSLREKEVLRAESFISSRVEEEEMEHSNYFVFLLLLPKKTSSRTQNATINACACSLSWLFLCYRSYHHHFPVFTAHLIFHFFFKISSFNIFSAFSQQRQGNKWTMSRSSQVYLSACQPSCCISFNTFAHIAPLLIAVWSVVVNIKVKQYPCQLLYSTHCHCQTGRKTREILLLLLLFPFQKHKISLIITSR